MSEEEPRVVMVTGCGSGIGRVTARYFATRGDHVYACGRSRAAPTREAWQWIRMDVADRSSVAGAVQSILKRSSRIDIVINNAGYELRGPVEETDDQEIIDIFNVNVLGSLRVIRAVLPTMRRQGGGVIVNVSSMLGFSGWPLLGAYCASKHALEAFSESLQMEVAGSGVRVIVVEPGTHATDLARHGRTARRFTSSSAYAWLEHSSRREARALLGGHPEGAPEDVAEAIWRAVGDRRTFRVAVGADVAALRRLRRHGPAAIGRRFSQ